MARSRCLVGWCEFSARLLRYFERRCSGRRHQLLMCHHVTGEFVGHQHPRCPSLLTHQLAEEAFRGFRVAVRLEQNVEDVAVLVDCPPQVVPDAADRDEHPVRKPCIAGSGSVAAQATRVFGPELRASCADRLVRDDDAGGEHQLRDVAQAQSESVVQPDAVRDDLRGKRCRLCSARVESSRVSSARLIRPSSLIHGPVKLTEPYPITSRSINSPKPFERSRSPFVRMGCGWLTLRVSATAASRVGVVPTGACVPRCGGHALPHRVLCNTIRFGLVDRHAGA